jgi:hypothetical protein
MLGGATSKSHLLARQAAQGKLVGSAGLVALAWRDVHLTECRAWVTSPERIVNWRPPPTAQSGAIYMNRFLASLMVSPSRR